MNNHGVSGRWFTETDVKHFKSGALRTIPSQVYFKDFVHRYRKTF